MNSLLVFPELAQAFSPHPLHQAGRLFEEKLYVNATPLYERLGEELLTTDPLAVPLTQRLANCYLELGQPSKALSHPALIPCWHTSLQALYYLGLAHKQLGDSDQSLVCLNQSLGLKEEKSPLLSFIELEKGAHFFKQGEFSQAQKAFENVLFYPHYPLLYYLAQLNLTKISLCTEKEEKAHAYLSQTSFNLAINHPLKKERGYLRGVGYLKQGKIQQAVEKLEQLSSFLSLSCPLLPLIHRNLATVYLKMASKETFSSPDRENALKKASANIHKLKLISPAAEGSDDLQLSLYLIKARFLQDQESDQQASVLLLQLLSSLSEEAQQTLWLRKVRAAPTYQQRCTECLKLVLDSNKRLNFPS